MATAPERFYGRIETLRERADRHQAEFEPPTNPPNSTEAMTYLRSGAGPAISVYIEARTGGQMVHFPPDQYHALETAMNDWFELYAACYDQNITAEFVLREAAELLLDTENIRDVAQVLTAVPDRH